MVRLCRAQDSPPLHLSARNGNSRKASGYGHHVMRGGGAPECTYALSLYLSLEASTSSTKAKLGYAHVLFMYILKRQTG